MQGNFVESLIGAVVLAVAGVFLAYVYTSVGADDGVDGYEVVADFNSVDGLVEGADVRMSGIKIGSISAMELDAETFTARVHLNLRDDVKLPDDSSAKVTSEGLLGGNYLTIEPGGSDKNLADGSRIARTQGSVNVMDLFAQAIFSATGAKPAEGGGSSPAPAPAPQAAPSLAPDPATAPPVLAPAPAP